MVALERGIEGLEQDAEHSVREIPMACVVNEVNALESCLNSRIASCDRSSNILHDLTAGTTLLICSWGSISSETERHLAQVIDLPPAALRMIIQTLRSVVADAVDANAQARFENRASLNRTFIVDKINSASELIDVKSLKGAIANGICSPFNNEPIETGDAFYEGVSTQPGHVGAGLVVPRPDLVSQVMAGLESSQAVLLVGPSGVGKSAVLWTLPSALPGVLWFRVHRISVRDVPHVVRLLRAYGASSKSPVGLLVDAAGRDHIEGWSRLRQSVAGMAGVLLVGTARSEDLFSLGDLADCTTVRVSLDEIAAAAIHAGLVRRGATSTQHWREAFEQSNGLTLEFTHLLTQGRRLNDVLADQIADRIQNGRDIELRILALVATADRWSASIPVGALDAAVGAEDIKIRGALERLIEEHLLIERDGMLVGIHQIRSRGIVDVIHRVPPPELRATVLLVLTALQAPDLTRFVYEVLREESALEEPVLQALEVIVRDDVESLVACLRGLELLDFYRQASVWTTIADRYDVPNSCRPIALFFAIAGIEFSEFFPTQLRTATTEMANLPIQSTTRDALLGAVGLDGIVSELTAATSTDLCLRLLRGISRTSLDWKSLLTALEPESPFVNFLQSCPVHEFGECVSTARDVSPELAKAFVDAVGGKDSILERLRNGDPWIRMLEVAMVDGKRVGVARFLCVSECEQDNAHERAVEIGRQLLRTLPDLDKVDVKAVLPGGRTLEIDGIDFGSTGLLSQYDHHPGAIAWNQQRARLAQTLLGASETERLAESEKLFRLVAELVRDFGNMFVLARGPSDESQELSERCSELNGRGARLRPRFGLDPASESSELELNDPLSATITAVCGNVLPRLGKPDGYPALSAYINGTVLGTHLHAAQDQPWRLIGFDDFPPSLRELRARLSEIDDVLTELIGNGDSIKGIVSNARSGVPKHALARAADQSRRLTRRRLQERRRAVRNELRTSGVRVNVFWSDGDPINSKLPNFAITVDLDSLADWPAARNVLVPKVVDLRSDVESPLLVPLLKGKTVPALAKKMTPKIWPAMDLGGFGSQLPPPLDQRLTAQVIAAHKSLGLCSGLSILNREGDLPDQVAELLNRTLGEFEEAIEAIRALPQDDVVAALVDWLAEIGERVKGEWDGPLDAGTYASSMAEGVLGDGSPEFEKLDIAISLALQWDSEPASAVALFNSLLEETSDPPDSQS